MFSQPLDTLLLQELAVAFPEVVHAPGVVFTAVERKREAADLEASLDHLGGDECPCVLAPRRDGPTPIPYMVQHTKCYVGCDLFLIAQVAVFAQGCAFETPHNSALVSIRIGEVGVSAQGCGSKEGSK